jgi:hypothetical protein
MRLVQIGMNHSRNGIIETEAREVFGMMLW